MRGVIGLASSGRPPYACPGTKQRRLKEGSRLSKVWLSTWNRGRTRGVGRGLDEKREPTARATVSWLQRANQRTLRFPRAVRRRVARSRLDVTDPQPPRRCRRRRDSLSAPRRRRQQRRLCQFNSVEDMAEDDFRAQMRRTSSASSRHARGVARTARRSAMAFHPNLLHRRTSRPAWASLPTSRRSSPSRASPKRSQNEWVSSAFA